MSADQVRLPAEPLATLAELDALNVSCVGGIMDCIRHSDDCGIWRGPGGCTCGAIDAAQNIKRLIATARAGMTTAGRSARGG